MQRGKTFAFVLHVAGIEPATYCIATAALPNELNMRLTDDVLPHEVPKPFESQNASRHRRVRVPPNDAHRLVTRTVVRSTS